MAHQPKQRRIRVRGQQRDDIDIDLLLQAVLSIAEDQARQRSDDSTAKPTPAERDQ